MKKLFSFLSILALLAPNLAYMQANFNPHFIISDNEMQDVGNWTSADIQRFLDGKGSFLTHYVAPDASGTPKLAADIIYEAALNYNINPKYILVTLQKEQSLITDDSPTQKQLDWATGYAVCDSCSMDDPAIQKHKGFGNQVDNAAGVIRWYYDNSDRGFVKKMGQEIYIDGTSVIPQSWATAFLYTYTPHLHGNLNFWRIWETWFTQVYPNGSLLKTASSSEVWLLQNGTRRKFKNQTALITRADPKMIVIVPDSELLNYQIGQEISLPNYSLLKASTGYYLLDYDTLRPFESEATVYKLGYNPDEVIEVADSDIAGYARGTTITATTAAPTGVIYQITDLGDMYFLLKDNLLQPISDTRVIDVNFPKLAIEKHKRKDLAQYQIKEMPVPFNDGALLRSKDSNVIYVVENGKKRRISDTETFNALGYKRANVVAVSLVTLLNIPEGEPLYLNSSLLSAKNKFLGDAQTTVVDQMKSSLPAYLIAEYPSGRILSGKNIDSVRAIASLTKLMTAYEALNSDFNAKGTTVFDAKKHAAYNNPLNLKTGEKIRNGDIFNVMLVGSVNVAARMVAQASGTDEESFIYNMNTRLANWGTDNTVLTDTTGLSDDNKSTARDLLKIFIKTVENETIKDTLFQTNFTFRELLDKNGVVKHTVKNTNLLLDKSGRNYRILASKTGLTDLAGACMAMLVESRKTKKQFVIITLGGVSGAKRFDEPHKMAEWAVAGKLKIANN